MSSDLGQAQGELNPAVNETHATASRKRLMSWVIVAFVAGVGLLGLVVGGIAMMASSPATDPAAPELVKSDEAYHQDVLDVINDYRDATREASGLMKSSGSAGNYGGMAQGMGMQSDATVSALAGLRAIRPPEHHHDSHHRLLRGMLLVEELYAQAEEAASRTDVYKFSEVVAVLEEAIPELYRTFDIQEGEDRDAGIRD